MIRSDNHPRPSLEVIGPTICPETQIKVLNGWASHWLPMSIFKWISMGKACFPIWILNGPKWKTIFSVVQYGFGYLVIGLPNNLKLLGFLFGEKKIGFTESSRALFSGEWRLDSNIHRLHLSLILSLIRLNLSPSQSRSSPTSPSVSISVRL